MKRHQERVLVREGIVDIEVVIQGNQLLKVTIFVNAANLFHAQRVIVFLKFTGRKYSYPCGLFVCHDTDEIKLRHETS